MSKSMREYLLKGGLILEDIFTLVPFSKKSAKSSLKCGFLKKSFIINAKSNDEMLWIVMKNITNFTFSNLPSDRSQNGWKTCN